MACSEADAAASGDPGHTVSGPARRKVSQVATSFRYLASYGQMLKYPGCAGSRCKVLLRNELLHVIDSEYGAAGSVCLDPLFVRTNPRVIACIWLSWHCERDGFLQPVKSFLPAFVGLPRSRDCIKPR